MAFSRFKDWAAYQKGFELARQVQLISSHFPKEEKYSLTDQIRRSSRSVCANLGEAFGKRIYPQHFKAKLSDAAAENFETQVWLDFAFEFCYLSNAKHAELKQLSEEVGKLLTYMVHQPSQYLPKLTN